MSDEHDLRELSSFLDGIPLFAALDEASRRDLAGQLEHVHVAVGEVIFRQGDAGEGLFLVLSGRVRLTVAAEGAEHTLYDLGRGAIVGEMALLTDRPRAATVHAVRDTDLLLLRVSSFRSLVERSPVLVAGMVRLLADRVLAVDRLLTAGRQQSPRPAARTIAVASAGRNPAAAAALARQLAAQLARSGSVFLMDAAAADRKLGESASLRAPGDPGRAELTEWLHEVERGHDAVIYQPDAADTAWSRLCLSQSDVVLLTAAATDDPSPGAVESRALAAGSLRCELALLHEAEPSGTAAWLAGRAVADHHHLRAGHPADVARLARMLTGTACGLVLGGGGARGFAHLGVLRALEEAGVPVDVVGGTSVGAVVGASFALGLDHAERVRRALVIARRSRRMVAPTFPLVALSSGRGADRLLAEALGGTPIEDLPVRFFCVSASLTRAEEIIHERGPLWPAVRASMSLPGIFPPVYAGGDLLVDGAALNNVPVDAMRGRVGNGCVVAVDLAPGREPLNAAPYAPGLSGWGVLGRRLNPFAAPRSVPGIADILSRSTGLSQVRHWRAALDGGGADVLLRPPGGNVRVLDFRGGIALIEAGYRHAAAALAESGLPGRFGR